MQNKDPHGGQVFIQVSTSEKSVVDFDVTTELEGILSTTTYQVSSGQPTRVSFTANDVYLTDIIERDKAILVQAKDGKIISVFVLNDEQYSTDGYVALPCDSLAVGSDFRSYKYLILSTGTIVDGGEPRASQFLIVTCEDATTVTVEPSTRISGSGVFQHPQFGPDTSQKSSKWEIGSSSSIPAKQTILISKETSDFTGTMVVGSKPLVVISGHQCGQVPEEVLTCDHIAAQIPPHTTWGYTFLLTPLDLRLSGDLYRFATLLDGTEVSITCVDAGSSVGTVEYQITLSSTQGSNWGQFQTHSGTCASTRKFCSLQSTQPLVVGHYSYGSSSDESCGKDISDELGDPFLNVIPPVVQYSNSYHLVPVTLTPGPVLARRVSVSVYAAYFNPLAIILDEDPLESSVTEWQAVYCSAGMICGYGITKELDNEPHILFHSEENATLFVYSYGFFLLKSYSLTGGMDLEPISGE